jgi:hypothetical protein
MPRSVQNSWDLFFPSLFSAAAQEVINSRSKLAFKTLIFQKCLMVTGLLFQLIAELFKPIAEWGAGFTTMRSPLIALDAFAGVTACGVGKVAFERRGE